MANTERMDRMTAELTYTASLGHYLHRQFGVLHKYVFVPHETISSFCNPLAYMLLTYTLLAVYVNNLLLQYQRNGEIVGMLPADKS